MAKNVFEISNDARGIIEALGGGFFDVIGRGVIDCLPLGLATGGFSFNVSTGDDHPHLLVMACRQPSVAPGFKITIQTAAEWDAKSAALYRTWSNDPCWSEEDRNAYRDLADDLEKELALKYPGESPRLGLPQACN